MRARDEQKPTWTRGRAGGQQEIEMKGPHMVESSGPFVKMIIVYELKSLNLHSDCHVMKIARSRPGLHNLTITPRNILPAGTGASDHWRCGKDTTFRRPPSVAGGNVATNMKS